MVVPGLLAYWLDSYWQTQPVLTLVGFTLGFAYGIFRLVLMGAQRQKNFVPTKPYNAEGLEEELEEEEQESEEF